MMTIRKLTNVVLTEQEAFLAYDSYGNPAEYSNPGGVVIREYDGSVYTFADRLARTLRNLIGNAKAFNASSQHVGKLIKSSLGKGFPMIGLVSWSGGGGHFVLIDGGKAWSNGTYYMSVCDPWDGELRLVALPSSGPVTYTPDYPALIKNQGSVAGGASNGTFNGWVVKLYPD